MSEQDQDQEERDEAEEITQQSVLENLRICRREMEYIKAVSAACEAGLIDALNCRIISPDAELHVSSWAHRCHMANHGVAEVAQDLAEQNHLLHELTSPLEPGEEGH